MHGGLGKVSGRRPLGRKRGRKGSVLREFQEGKVRAGDVLDLREKPVALQGGVRYALEP